MLYPILGGLLIGLAVISMMYFLGRITGISGILWSAISQPSHSIWRWLFLLGLIIGTTLFHQVSQVPHPTLQSSPLSLIVAGLLVGIGVKLGSGCTSGHGVCGIGRLSFRSLIATITFMSFGMVTVFVLSSFN